MKAFFTLLAWVAGGLLVLGVLAIGGFWWFLDYSAERMCDNQVISTTELPEVGRKVVVFQRDCGATTGFSTQVSMLEIGKQLPNESGNLFTADTNHGRAPGGDAGGPVVRVEVISAKQVRILHHPDARVFNHQNQWQGIAIEYGDL